MSFFDHFSLTAMMPVGNSKFVGAFVLDRITDGTDSPHAAIFLCDFENAEAREIGFLDYRVCGITVARIDDPESIILGEWGQLNKLAKDGLIALPAVPTTRGPLRRIRHRFGWSYALGSGGQILRSKSVGSEWMEFGPTLEDYDKRTIFTDIDGFDPIELYVCGSRGHLWRLVNNTWQQIHCATNLAFHAIHCAEDGFVYACGQLGLLARGRGDRFEIISPSSESLVDLWGVGFFDAVPICSSFRALMYWDGQELVPYLPAMKSAPYFYGLEHFDGAWWSSGEKSILRWNGTNWDSRDDFTWIDLDK